MEKTITTKQKELAQILDENVLSVIGNDRILGFEKAFMISKAISKLKDLISADYMKPIMELQGNRLGFKTDKDKEGGYPESVVKNCLIESVLMGVQPFGNQFNIIASNSYITKEGFGFLLKNIRGLSYDISFALPRIGADKSSAAVVAKINWQVNGEGKKEKEIDIPVKANQYMGADAVLGKATRKARKWLYETITGVEVGDGDVTDGDCNILNSNKIANIDKSEERVTLMIGDARSEEELNSLRKSIVTDVQADLFAEKMSKIKNKD